MTNPPQDEPFFITEEIEAEMLAAGHVFEPPALFTTTNSYELYGLRPGETVAEAIARHQVGQKAEPAVRRLTADQLTELRRDMAESSQWMQAELRRRKTEKESGVF